MTEPVSSGIHPSPACLICGSEKTYLWLTGREILHLTPSIYSLYRCRDCKVKFVSPQPGPEELAELYGSGFYAGAQSGKRVARRVGRLADFLASFRAHEILKAIPAPGKILDIGCGAGSFLAAMKKRGWQASGIDPSPEARNAAPEDLRDAIRIGQLADLPPDPVWDAMTFWHSLEHAPDPSALVREAARRLREGGVLLIAVPLGTGIGSWLRSRWAFLDLPRHLFHFSPESLRSILTGAGFQVTRESFFSWEYSFPILLLNLLNLVTPQPMYLYYLLKRGDLGKRRLSLFGHWANAVLSAAGLLFFPILVLILGSLLAGLRRGDSYLVAASKKDLVSL